MPSIFKVPSKLDDDPFKELIEEAPIPHKDPDPAEEDGGFDDFQEAEVPISSIQEQSDSRHDSNIFSNSKQDIDNSFTSHEGPKKQDSWAPSF